MTEQERNIMDEIDRVEIRLDKVDRLFDLLEARYQVKAFDNGQDEDSKE